MDMTVIKQMVVAYLKEKIGELDSAISNQNYEEIKGISHKIKGNSGSLALGLNVFNDIGKNMEKAAIDNEPMSVIQQYSEELKSEYAKIL